MTVERLTAWTELWRYPALFVRVHGARASLTNDPTTLRAALFEDEFEDPADAWNAILAHEDLSAVQAAYERLAPEIGLAEARRDLARARQEFLRRIENLRDRVRPLGSAWAGVDATLRASVAAHLDHPREAERLLAEAHLTVAEAEHKELKRLARLAPKEESAGTSGLSAAIAAGDLRLAQIHANRLVGLPFNQRALEHDLRVDKTSTQRLLAWRLDADLAPSWLPRVALAENDAELLRRLAEALETGSITNGDAAAFVRSSLRFLLAGGPEPQVVADEGVAEGFWAFIVSGATAAALFPHVADNEDRVTLVLPRTAAIPPPTARDDRRLMAWDLFEVWPSGSRPEVVVATPRMVLDLLVAGGGRPPSWVRLLSSCIPVRTLLLHVLGQDETRFRRFAGLAGEQGDEAGRNVLEHLFEALDLYADEGDLLVLSDASGERLSWLMLVMSVAARASDPEPASNRRFDALGIMRRPAVERELDAAFEEELNRRFADRFAVALLLDIVEAELDRDVVPASGVPRPELAAAIVQEGLASELSEAESKLDALLLNGLLRPAQQAGETNLTDSISPTLPRPGRFLLRA